MIGVGMIVTNWLVRANSNQTLPSDIALLKNFEETAFRANFGPFRISQPTLHRLEISVRIRISGHGYQRHLEFMRHQVSLLSSLTGLEMSITELSGSLENVTVEFAPETKLYAAAVRAGTDRDYAKRLKTKAICFIQPNPTGQRYQIAFIFISNDLPHIEIRSCIAEELTHLVGLIGHSEAIRDSVIGSGPSVERMSISDMLLIRTLYDPRLVAGMPKAEALRVASEIIPRLKQAYLVNGIEALHLRR